MAVVISDRLLESKDRLLDAESDEQLVRLVHGGQEAAFAAIVRRYERELQAQARRLTSDGRGDDAVQQAFLNAFAALQRGAEIRHLRGWLHHILRNEVIRSRVPVDAPLDAAVSYGETLEDTVQRRATIHATLAQLSAMPDRQRDALLATAVLGFPRAHVARTMGLSEGAVRQLVHRARLRLRQAASALIPFPLFKLFGAARSGMDAGSDAALGAAASGGLAVKVGALVASGVVATGIAVTQTFPPRHHATSAARGARQHGVLTRAPARISAGSGPSAAPNNPALVTTSLRLDEHGLGATGAQGRAHGGPARLSGAQSEDRGGPGSGRGRGDSRGLDGSSTGPGDDGSGRLAGGSSGRGPSRDGSGSRSGPSSGAGSGDDGSTTRSGGSGSGSGSGRQSDSGSGTSGSGSRDGGPGSGSSGSDGGTVTTTDGDASAASLTGSSGATSTPPATTTGDVTSGQDGSSSGGLSSGGSGGSSGGSGRGGTESSGGSRDLSGSLDSSSS